MLECVTPSQIQNISTRICEHISADKTRLSNAQTIALFAAHNKEIDLSSLHQLLPSKRFVYPKCRAHKQLTFHHVDTPKTMTAGTWGILEPCDKIHPQVDITNIDLFLCPGLAFAQNGSRLGYGGGYYDRALAEKSPTAQAWGVCMQQQQLAHLISNELDQRMHGIITESGFIPAKPD